MSGAEAMFIAACHSGSAKDAKMMGDLLAAVTGANAPQKQELMLDAVATPGRAKDIMAEAFTVAITEKKERLVAKDIDYYGDDSEPDPDSESDTQTGHERSTT